MPGNLWTLQLSLWIASCPDAWQAKNRGLMFYPYRKLQSQLLLERNTVSMLSILTWITPKYDLLTLKTREKNGYSHVLTRFLIITPVLDKTIQRSRRIHFSFFASLIVHIFFSHRRKLQYPSLIASHDDKRNWKDFYRKPKGLLPTLSGMFRSYTKLRTR